MANEPTFQGTDYYQIEELLDPEERLVRDTARQFVEQEYAPVVTEHFRRGTFPVELAARIGALGFYGANLPTEYGCAGLNNVATQKPRTRRSHPKRDLLHGSGNDRAQGVVVVRIVRACRCTREVLRSHQQHPHGVGQEHEGEEQTYAHGHRKSAEERGEVTSTTNRNTGERHDYTDHDRDQDLLGDEVLGHDEKA